MIIKNKILPPKGFNAMAIFPFIFTRSEVGKLTLNHEKIHFAQQKELLIIFFYLLYAVFYLLYGYKNSPFEKEAYRNGYNLKYLEKRKLFSWVKYLKQ